MYSGFISAFVTETANTKKILPQQSNLLIQARKTMDNALIRIKVLEQWQFLKVHSMSLLFWLLDRRN